MNQRIGVLPLILWPSVVTLLVSVARLVAELSENVTAATGGAGVPLGITWLAPVFGGWWALRFAGEGDTPRSGALLRALLALVVVVTAVALRFGGVDRGDQGDAAFEALRGIVLSLCAVAVAAALVAARAWPRLALVLFAYAIPARLTVLIVTVLSKQYDWNTHYTKFGPAGIERPMGDTVLAASIAQFGFWVPFTVVCGVAAGAVVATLRRQRSAA